MPRKDYATRQVSFGKKKNSSRWKFRLFAAALFIGLIFCLIFLVKHRHSVNSQHKIVNKAITVKNTKPVSTAEINMLKSHYAFYDMLPKGKVMLPERYELVVTVSANKELVERRQAKLAAFGLDSGIDEIEKNNKIMYKLVVGPYDNKNDAINMQQQLQNKGIHSVLRKL
jgi:cell division protein FtsN